MTGRVAEMRKRTTDSRAFRLAGRAVAVVGAAVLGTTQTGLIDVNSLLRMTDFFSLNPLW
jgi:hypothetical protein